MKVSKDNIKYIQYYAGLEKRPVLSCGLLLETLLNELEGINNVLDKRMNYGRVFIDYCDEHTEYSPERTEPCPDYYGTFSLRWEDTPCDTIGENGKTLPKLDSDICFLSEFVDKLYEHWKK